MTDYINPDHSVEYQYTGIVDPDQSSGVKCEGNLNTCQPEIVPPGLAWFYPQPAPAAPAPEPQPAVPVDPTARHTELLNSALTYARMGWPVIPCHWIWEHAGEKHCSCNKADCDSPGKHPIGKLTPHGLKEATTDPETIRKWWDEYPNANIAVVTGEASGIVAIDLDIKDGKDGLVALEKWCQDNGVAMPETIIQQTGSGGFHYLFRYPAGLDIHGATDVLKNDSGIDVRGQNGYIMVEPSCNANGLYSWIADNDPFSGATPANLPPKLLELIGGRKKAPAPPGAGVVGAKWIVHEETVQEVIDALRFIPADLYQTWIEIGHALKMMGLGERGFQIWDEWSQKSSKYDPKVMRSKWRSFGPTDITYRTIFFEAQKHGWINPQATAADGAVMPYDPATGEVIGTVRPFDEVIGSAPAEVRELAEKIRAAISHINPRSQMKDGKASCSAAQIIGRAICAEFGNQKLGDKRYFGLGLSLCAEWDARHRTELDAGCEPDALGSYLASVTYNGKGFTSGSIFRLAKDNGWDDRNDSGVGADIGIDVPRPKATDEMFYGLVGEVARAGSENTEANPVSIALGFMTWLSAQIGRDVYLPIGDNFHHCRLFGLHVGRSMVAAKGESLKLTQRIDKKIRSLDDRLDSGIVLGHLHKGGLSTREGLISMIHDEYKSRNGKVNVPGIDDKRLFVIEEEFVNVLHQGKRDGNTLSAALRTAWDGVTIDPATKNDRIGATDPHIAIIGSITPSELHDVMDARELTNGFANRFLIVWAERTRHVPLPPPTPESTVLELAIKARSVIDFAKGNYPATKDSRAMGLSEDACALWCRVYADLKSPNESSVIDGIVARRAPYALRLAMLFALLDKTLIIEVKHLRAALAWIDYYEQSVRFIFASKLESDGDEKTDEDAETIITYLRSVGEASRSDIVKEAFKGHIDKKRLDKALRSLQDTIPAKIEVCEQVRSDGRRGRGKSVFRVAA